MSTEHSCQAVGGKPSCQDLVNGGQHLLKDLHWAKDECVLVSQGLCHPSRVLPSYFYVLICPIKGPFMILLKNGCSLLVSW